MTSVPSHIPASAAQAGIQAHEVAKEREARRTGQAETVKRQARAVDEAGATVDTDDSDVAVFSDSEGAGSEGRQNEEETTTEAEGTKDTPSDAGISLDDEGHLHVDLQA